MPALGGGRADRRPVGHRRRHRCEQDERNSLPSASPGCAGAVFEPSSGPESVHLIARRSSMRNMPCGTHQGSFSAS